MVQIAIQHCREFHDFDVRFFGRITTPIATFGPALSHEHKLSLLKHKQPSEIWSGSSDPNTASEFSRH